MKRHDHRSNCRSPDCAYEVIEVLLVWIGLCFAFVAGKDRGVYERLVKFLEANLAKRQAVKK